MGFEDLSAVIKRRTLTLPVNGKKYIFVEPDAETGLWVQQLVFLGERAADDDADADTRLAALLGDDEEKDLYTKVLGDKWDELAADGVTLSQVQHIGQTVAVWIVYGEAVAEAIWAGQGNGQGEAERPANSSRRASEAGAATTRNGAGSTTKKSRRGRGGRTSSPSGRT